MTKRFTVIPMDRTMVNESVDLFIQTFSNKPWNDVYASRSQVVDFFENHLNNNYFVGYVGIVNDTVIALCLGFKKPWINGLEYYIDEFCVSTAIQGCGIGSDFLEYIDADIKQHGMNAIILNTKKAFPAKSFYEKNGFKPLDEFIILAK